MFLPTRNLVTVVLDPKDAKTKGGLVLPDNFKDVFITGTVRATGPGRILESGGRDEVGVRPGDRVLIGQHIQHTPNGSRILPYPDLDDQGTKCILLDASEILGIIDRPLPQALKIADSDE